MPGNGEPTLRHRKTVAALVVVLGVMLCLTFAAVPFYRAFCQLTGYGGTPKRAEQIPDKVFDRHVTVRFNADTDPGLPWKFEPEQHSVDIKIGENKLIFYRAENKANHPITGQAIYNVTPDKVGAYFTKVQCFCFNQQTLQAGQKVDMPVSFFIDPAFTKDDNMKDVTSVTLSYTFYNETKDAGAKTAAAQ